MAKNARTESVTEAIAELKQLLGVRATDADTVREHHSHGESYHTAGSPRRRVFPTVG